MIKSVFAAMAAVALVACAQPSSEEVVVDQPQEAPVETPAPALVDTPPENAVKVP